MAYNYYWTAACGEPVAPHHWVYFPTTVSATNPSSHMISGPHISSILQIRELLNQLKKSKM